LKQELLYEQKQRAWLYDDAWLLDAMQQQLEQHGATCDPYESFYDFVTNFICGRGYCASCGQENGESEKIGAFCVNGSCGDVCCENDDAFSNGSSLFLFL